MPQLGDKVAVDPQPWETRWSATVSSSSPRSCGSVAFRPIARSHGVAAREPVQRGGFGTKLGVQGLLALPHAAEDGDQGCLLRLGQVGVGADGDLYLWRGVAAVATVVEQAGLGEEGLGGQVERSGDRLQHPDRGLVQAALQLAQVGVGDAGQLGQLAQGQVGELALHTDEGAERLHLRLPRIGGRHGECGRPFWALTGTAQDSLRPRWVAWLGGRCRRATARCNRGPAEPLLHSKVAQASWLLRVGCRICSWTSLVRPLVPDMGFSLALDESPGGYAKYT